uniref:DDE Tnp4 domain-containing protein n=1 Tax=Triticum urartu TaxID=4572 RepID=A0A8R7UIY8_TRIUA
MGPTHSKSPFPCSVSRRAQNPPVPENRIFGDYVEPTHTSKSAGRQTSPRAPVPLARSPPPASQRRQPPTSLPLSICHSSLSSADSLSSPSSLPSPAPIPSPPRRLSPDGAHLQLGGDLGPGGDLPGSGRRGRSGRRCAYRSGLAASNEAKMVSKMNKRKRMARGAAVFVALAAMAVIVRAIIRKMRPRITYGPMHERDRIRYDYLNQKIWQSDVLCKNMLRFERAAFFCLCGILRDRNLLQDSPHLSVEQQLAMFLHTIVHNLRNRVVSANFGRSYGTTSIYFRKALHAIGELRNDYIRPPSLETPAKIIGNHRFDPYFKDCIGAIDGTQVRAGVTKDVEPSFRGRKAFTTQNVMAAVDFDLCFTYVLAGWEGSAHDATVLADALTRERGLQVPPGKYYLVDAGYGAKPGFLPPFRGMRYHLNEWGNNPVQNDKELFNLRHSSLRVTVERAFGSLKRRFKILDDAKPFFTFPVQVDIVIACCVLHNYALSQGIDEFIIPEVTWTTQPIRTSRQQLSDNRALVDHRLQIAAQMWEDRQLMYANL